MANKSIEIFIINLARSKDRRESMKRKIAGIRGFREIYIDGEKVGNLSLGMQFAPFSHKTSLDERQVLSRSFHTKTAQSHTANTSIVLNAKCAESSLRGESLDSPKQSKNKINPCDSTQNSPASWCKKSDSKDAEVPSADFLLEAEKRGSPPKSEKAAAFWRVGGAGRGVQPFLRKESSKSNAKNGENLADSALQHCDSYNLDSRDLDCFGESNDSPRNDGRGDLPLQKNDSNNSMSSDLDSSLVALAQNDKVNVNSHNTILNFHFFVATDANDFKANPANIPAHYRSKFTRFVKGKDLSFGEIACFSSHYRLWEKCVALDSPIVVLEDDIDFMQDFCQITEIAKSPFEYVRLYYLFDRKISQIYDNFYISFDRISGGQGYYLTPKAARKFIKNAIFWLFCVDDYMDMFFIHNVKNIIFLPFIIAEDSANATQSTISGREKPKMNFWRKLTREMSRIYFYVIRKGLYMLVFYAYGRRICPHSSLRGESQDSPKQSTNQKNGLPRKSYGFSRNDGEV